MRGLVVLFGALALAGCSAPAPAVDQAPVEHVAAAPGVEQPPTLTLTIDETFDSWDVEAAQQQVAGWCGLDPSLCIQTTVGPVVDGQPSSMQRVATGCPELGQDEVLQHQIKIFTACDDRQFHLTHGMVMAHELGHFWGAQHIGPNNTMSAGPRLLARCITYDDLAEVCSHHDCQAPRFDLVCSDAAAIASNPYNASEAP